MRTKNEKESRIPREMLRKIVQSRAQVSYVDKRWKERAQIGYVGSSIAVSIA